MDDPDRFVSGTNGYNLHVAMVDGEVYVRMRSAKNGKSHCLVKLTVDKAAVFGLHLTTMGEATTEEEESACG